jgi:glucose-fructose oxidoreductase
MTGTGQASLPDHPEGLAMNPISKSELTRRRFLQHSAVAPIAGLAFPSIISAAARGRTGVAPNDKISVALIGAGPQGQGVMKGFLVEEAARVVAVCDLKPEQLQQARDVVNQKYGNQDCATFTDFREVLARRDIDAVIVATPDHWHVLAGIAAVRAGKDIYLEKPMGLSVAEDVALRAAVRKTGRIFQFGTQQRSSAFFRRACEIVRNGRIGKLQNINVWCIGSVPGGSTAVVPVPTGFDYDRWLGPAPLKPYRENLCSADGAKKTWWFNSDYALGFIAGWGVHPLDIAYWGYPEMMKGKVEVSGTGTIPTEGACDTATAWDVNFRFADGVTLNYRGLPIAGNTGEFINNARVWQEKYHRTCDHGTAFEGTDGWVHVDRQHVASQPAELVKEDEGSYKVQLVRSSYHAQNFLESVRSRRPAIAHIEDAFQSDVLCHLSDLAIRTGRKLVWDPKKEHFVGDREADRRLKCRKMRKPWKL